MGSPNVYGDKPVILAHQRRPRPHRLVVLRRDQLAVAAVDEAIEEGLGEEFVGLSPRHAMFLGEGEGFRHRLDRGPQQEVARQLDYVGGTGVVAEVEDPLARRLLKRSHPRPRRGFAGSHDPQLCLGRDLRLAEDRRGDVAAASLPVQLRQPVAVRGAIVLIDR